MRLVRKRSRRRSSIGSLAGLNFAERASEQGLQLTFRDHAKAGVLITILSMLFAGCGSESEDTSSKCRVDPYDHLSAWDKDQRVEWLTAIIDISPRPRRSAKSMQFSLRTAGRKGDSCR